MDRARPAEPRSRILNALTAAAADQLRLLDVQGLDSRLDQLEHRRRRLPQHDQIARASSRLTELGALLIAAQTELDDIDRELHQLTSQSEVDADLERLKAELGSGAPPQQSLEPGEAEREREA